MKKITTAERASFLAACIIANNITAAGNRYKVDARALPDSQLARAMHAARRIQLSSASDSQDWADAATLLQTLTAENARRLGFDGPVATMVVRGVK